MSYRKELSLEDIAREFPSISDDMERILATYVSRLRRVLEMPIEFERRCRASWIEVLLEKTRQSYQNVLARCQMFGFASDMLIGTVATVLRQPLPMPGQKAISLLCLGIWPSGDIKPVLRDESLKQSGIVTVSLEQFEEVGGRLKNDVLSGKLRPEREDEIPRLIYENLARGEAES
ncbi:MAG: hypothetical protein DRI01_07715 [Chloroflexi bacterium]|nr:MAG: hypothetical protein DRI01_07715 [Chloroflexota bacterium]